MLIHIQLILSLKLILPLHLSLPKLISFEPTIVIFNPLAKPNIVKPNALKYTCVGTFVVVRPKFLSLVHPNHQTLSSMLQKSHVLVIQLVVFLIFKLIIVFNMIYILILFYYKERERNQRNKSQINL